MPAKRKLTDQEVKEIRERLASSTDTYEDIAEEYDIHSLYASALFKGRRRKKAGGPILKEDRRGTRKVARPRVISNAMVVKLREDAAETDLTFKALARKYRISTSYAAQIARGFARKYVGGPITCRGNSFVKSE